jgi:hypothetical protein
MLEPWQIGAIATLKAMDEAVDALKLIKHFHNVKNQRIDVVEAIAMYSAIDERTTPWLDKNLVAGILDALLDYTEAALLARIDYNKYVPDWQI